MSGVGTLKRHWRTAPGRSHCRHRPARSDTQSYEALTLATDVHAVVRRLGFTGTQVAGYDAVQGRGSRNSLDVSQ